MLRLKEKQNTNKNKKLQAEKVKNKLFTSYSLNFQQRSPQAYFSINTNSS